MSLISDSKDILERAARIKLLVLDVDGVLTDGRLQYTESGLEQKSFHTRDVTGLKLFLAAHLEVAILSGRDNSPIRHFARDVGIRLVRLGISDKVAEYESLLDELGCEDQEVAYVGDDLPDIPLLERSGLGCAVSDAVPEVRAAADFILRTPGGHGAVREICERLLKARGRWIG